MLHIALCVRFYNFRTFPRSVQPRTMSRLGIQSMEEPFLALNIQESPASRLHGTSSMSEHLLVSLTPSGRRGWAQHIALALCRHSVSVGPIVILLASNFLVSMLVGYLESLAVLEATIVYPQPQLVFYLLFPVVGFAVLSLFYPYVTWLIDNYCGRRKAMQGALVLILVPALFTSISLLAFLGPGVDVASVFEQKNFNTAVLRTTETFAFVSLCCLFVGVLIFKAGVVQLGSDKIGCLTPAKASWLAHWLLWTEYAGREIPNIFVATSFFGSGSTRGYCVSFIVMTALLCVLTSLKCVQCVFNRCYFREPKSDNQCLLICRVLHHSRKNRGNEQRERRENILAGGEEPTSYLDAAKVQCGGPFNSIQVERVKATLSVLLRIVAIAFASSLSICAQWLLPLLSRNMDVDSDFTVATIGDFTPAIYLENIIKRINGFGNLSNLFLILLIPFMCPVLAKSVTAAGSLKKFGIGLALLAMSVLCSFVMDTVSSFKHQGPAVCGFNFPADGSVAETYNTSSLLLVLQNVLNAFSVLFTYTAALEYVLLSAPAPMRATLLCVLFCLQGLFSFIGVLVVLPFSLHFGKAGDLPRFLPCTFGYYVINLSAAMILLAVFAICAGTYKPPAYIGSNPLDVSADRNGENDMESSTV